MEKSKTKNRDKILVETKTGHGPYPLGMEYTQGDFRELKKQIFISNAKEAVFKSKDTFICSLIVQISENMCQTMGVKLKAF